MKDMKRIFLNLPEYYFAGLMLITGAFPSVFVNLFFVGVFIIIILQIIFRNRISGIILGTLIFLANLYFLGALLSEFHEFTEFNKRAQKLLFVGMSIWIVNLIFSVAMIYRYAAAEEMRNSKPKIGH